MSGSSGCPHPCSMGGRGKYYNCQNGTSGIIMFQNEKSNIVALAVLFVILIAPIISPEEEVLFCNTGVVEPGHFVVIDEMCEGGAISFSFETTGMVDAFVLDEAQFYSFMNSGDFSSLSYDIGVESGLLSCSIAEAQVLYFVLDNDLETGAEITVFEIFHSGPRVSILEYLFTD